MNMTIIIPASTFNFNLPFFFVTDDDINEPEQRFALVAQLGSDVGEEFVCFQREEDEPRCFGRQGATQIRITDDDRKYKSNNHVMK